MVITLKNLHWEKEKQETQIYLCVHCDGTFKLLVPSRSFLPQQQVQRTVSSQRFLLHEFEGRIHVIESQVDF